MKKNIFLLILAIFAVIFVIAFGMTTYRYYVAIHSDDPIDPYISVEKGETTITRGEIAIDMSMPESYNIREGDIIITRSDSLAVIFWPDHSTTRLADNSRLTIDRMRVASDYSKIELVATLENGKAWSNIVRTLYPDSRVEFNLPKSGTVAGVRGTVFEINLDENYIHSVNHSVTLKNSFGKIVTLLPGEAVLANNILQKFNKSLDIAWISLNNGKDMAYASVRDAKIQASYTLLVGKSQIFDVWDNLVRWILSYFDAFRDIEVLSLIDIGDLSQVSGLPEDIIIKWYQAFQSKDFVQQRDLFRGTMLTLADTFKNGDQLIEMLARGAMWDVGSDSGLVLGNTKSLLDAYSRKTGINLDILTSQFEKIDTQALTKESRILYDQLFK